MPARIRTTEAAMPVMARALVARGLMRVRADDEQQARVLRAQSLREPTGCPEHEDPADEKAACRASFLHFLRWWKFINRETGKVQNFLELWEGQQRMVAAMEQHRQVLILKAGKLGASELACAYDGYRLVFGDPNTRVHLFSMDDRAAKNMLRVVKFGMEHLPEWMALPTMVGQAGGETATQIMFRAGTDDVRTVVSYAPTESAAIDQSAQHSHVDELARMKWPESTWAAVSSTIAPGGTCHIVSRGNGAENYLAKLWEQCKQPTSAITPIFEPWNARPRFPETDEAKVRVEAGANPGAEWYAETEASMPTTSQLYYYAPRTAEEALAGAGEDAFIDMARWDACYEPNNLDAARRYGRPGYMPPLQPGDEDQVVISLDAGITNDIFALTLTTRHPGYMDTETGLYIQGSAKPTVAAIRGYKAWVPKQAIGGEVDFDEVERFVRCLCQGGCLRGHPNAPGKPSAGLICSLHPDDVSPHPLARSTMAKEFCGEPGIPCPDCAAGQRFPRLNVVQVVYDRYELHDMMQSLARDRIAWVDAMDQGGERTQADTDFRSHLIQRTVVHTADPADSDNLLRRHIQGAKAKIPTGDDNRCRIEKRGPSSKVDLAVSASMGIKRCLFLVLRPPPRT